MAHYMRRNHANRIPGHHVCLATISPPAEDGSEGRERPHLLGGVAVSKWRHRGAARTNAVRATLLTRGAFWDWLGRASYRGCRLWVWSHDASRDFTAVGLWERIASGLLTIDEPPGREVQAADGSTRVESTAPSLITAPGCFLCDCHDSEGRAYRFVSTMNFVGAGSEDLTSILGMEVIPEPGEIAEPADWIAWADARCDLTRRVVVGLTDWVRADDLGNMQFTLGGQSMSFYRHKHLQHDIVVGPDDDIRPLERRGYYGARQQVYFRGGVLPPGTEVFMRPGTRDGRPPMVFTDGIYRIDCNQCYPYVMSQGRYPVRLYRRLEAPPVAELKAALVHYPAVACVRIYSQKEPYPQRRKGKTSWKVGRVDTVLCGPELERAVASGHVIGVEVAQLYHAGDLFGSWFDAVQKMRADAQGDADPLRLALVKRLANSLHGKFGQSGRQWEMLPGQTAPQSWGEYAHHDLATGSVERRRAIDGAAQVMREADDGRGCCPAIAAWVCSYAREHMRSIRLEAGERNVFYEDADSLHVSQSGFDRLSLSGRIHPLHPGSFKCESVVHSAEYRGVKHYRHDGNWTIAGHSLTGTYDLRGDWSQVEFTSMDGLLSSGLPTNPISTVRKIGPIEADPDCGYAADGWIVYHSGG